MAIKTLADKEDPEHEPVMFMGIDLSTPCLKTSLMNGIGSGMAVGVVYNLVNFKLTFLTSFIVVCLVPTNAKYQWFTVVSIVLSMIVLFKHGRIPENVRRLLIIADKCGYPQVCKSKILIYLNTGPDFKW